MKIFLSHAAKDRVLASQLAEQLRAVGFHVFNPYTDLSPGENWAKRLGNELQDSEFIVFLLTPGALQTDWLRMDIEFALGSKKHDGRVFSVFVGPTLEAGKDMPWILLKLPHLHIESAADLAAAVVMIESLCADKSATHG